MRTWTLVTLCAGLWATAASAGEVLVPLEVHQALRPGVAGVECQGVPVTAGIPLPAAWKVGERDGRPALAVRGSSVYQFRTLRNHDDGSVAWALADFQADIPAGAIASGHAIVTGDGASSAPALAVDRGDTIVVDTGPLQAVIRKRRFNLLDSVTVAGKEIVPAGTSRGLVCLGPDGTEFLASSDETAVVTVEENGPVRCVIMAEGAHRDAAGKRHFGWVVRMHFSKGSDQVRLFHTLRNASKEQVEDARTAGVLVSLAIDGVTTASAATPDGAMAVDLPARAVQGHNGFPNNEVKMLTKEQTGTAVGFTLTGAGKAVVAQADAKALGPDLLWMDAATATGAGVAAGIRFAMGWFPKAIAVDAGGLTVECWPRDNPPGYCFRFGAHATTEILLAFHAAPLTDMPARMGRFQYRPIAKAPVEHFNACDVVPLRMDRMVTYRQELETYERLGLGSLQHAYSTTKRIKAPFPPFRIWRYHYWGTGGGLNQSDFARVALINALRMTDDPQVAGSLWLEGEQRLVYNSDFATQHYDDFKAGEKLPAPTRGPINNNKVVFEDEHPHWIGMALGYYLTGDERLRRSVADWGERTLDTPRVAVPTYTRYYGWGMRTVADMAQFFRDDPARAKRFQDLVDTGVRNLLTAHAVDAEGRTILGHDWNRGFTVIQKGGVVERNQDYIACKPFMDGYIIWDNLYYCLLHHPDGHGGRYWLSANPEVERFGDLLANAIEFFQNEAWFEKSNPPDDGPNGSGMPYTFALYAKNQPLENTWKGYADREVWNLFAVAYDWTGEQRFLDRCRQCLAKVATCNGGTFWLQDQPGVQRLLWLMSHPKPDGTAPAAITDLTARRVGDDAVELTWTAPADAAAYQIKFAPRRFAEWLGWNHWETGYKLDPQEFIPWPAGENVADEPKPTPGKKQTHVVRGLKPGAKYFFAIRSWNAADRRSGLSNETSVEVP